MGESRTHASLVYVPRARTRGVFTRALRHVPVAMVVLFTSLVTGAAYGATLASYPDDGLVTDGVVHTVTTDAQHRTYYGGQFSRIGSYSGSGVVLDQSLTQVSQRAVFDGPVRASVSDGQGGWFVGGAFHNVNNTPTFGLAHIMADGMLDMSFRWGIDPSSSTAQVNALALTPAGHLVIGGAFNALRRPDGSLVNQPNVAVLSLASNGDHTLVSPQPIATAAVVDLAVTGSITPRIWIARDDDGNSGTSELQAWDLGSVSPAMINIYSGDIRSITAAPGNLLAITGTFIFAPGIGITTPYALAVINDSSNVVWGMSSPMRTAVAVDTASSPMRVYVGGSDDISGIRAFNLASGIPITIALPAGSPSTETITDIAVARGSLLVGRSNTGASDRALFAQIDTTSGTLISSNTLTPERPVRTIATTCSTSVATSCSTFIGGDFTAISTKPRSNIARTLASGELDTSWSPTVGMTAASLTTSQAVTSMRMVGTDAVAVGGAFTSVGSATSGMQIPASGLAVVSASTGTPTQTYIEPSGATFRVDDLTERDGRLFVVASVLDATGQREVVRTFTGTLQQHPHQLVALGATGTNPSAMSSADAARFSIEAAPPPTTGGAGTVFVGGPPRSWKLVTSTTSGVSATSSPLVRTTITGTGDLTPPTAIVGTGEADALYLSPSNPNRLWVGGTFSPTASSSRPSAINVSSGASALPSGWPSSAVNYSVRTIIEHDGQVYAGGDVPVAPTTPNLVSWSSSGSGWQVNAWKQFMQGDVHEMAVRPDGSLIVVGTFDANERRHGSSIASFSPSSSAPAPTELIQHVVDPVTGLGPLPTASSTRATSVMLQARIPAGLDSRPIGMRIQYSRNNGPPAIAFDQPGGWRLDRWSPNAPPPVSATIGPLTDGMYTWSANTINADGVTSTSSTITTAITGAFTIDTTAPTATSPVIAGAGPSPRIWLNKVQAIPATFADAGTATNSFCISTSVASCAVDPTAPADTGAWQTWTPSAATVEPVTQPQLTEGATYAICQRATDQAGNVSTTVCSAAFRWDSQAPTSPTLSGINPYSGGTVVASMAGDDPTSGIALLRFESSTSPAFTPTSTAVFPYQQSPIATGTFSTVHPWNTTQLTGTFYIRIVAIDAAGNTSISPSISTEIDNVSPPAPQLTVSSSPDQFAIKHVTTPPVPTVIVRGSYSGTIEVTPSAAGVTDVAKVAYSDAAGNIDAATPLDWSTNKKRIYTVRAGTMLHGIIKVRLIDRAGNAATSQLRIDSDALAPNASISTPPPSSSRTDIAFTVTGSDVPDGLFPNAGMDWTRPFIFIRPNTGTPQSPVWGSPVAGLTLQSAIITNTQRRYSLPATMLTDGRYGIEIAAQDEVGNTQAATTPSPFIVDRTPPTLTPPTATTNAAPGTWIDTSASPPVVWIRPSTSGTVPLTVTSTAHDALSGIADIASASGTCTSNPAVPVVGNLPITCTYAIPRLAATNATISVAVTDGAGNAGPAPADSGQVQIRYDSTPPAPPALSAASVNLTGTTYSFAGTFTNAADIAEWKLERIDPVSGTRTLIVASSTVLAPSWQASFDSASLADGQYPIILTVQDRVGNQASASYLLRMNRSTKPATPDIRTLTPADESTTPALNIGFNPNADQELSSITVEVTPYEHGQLQHSETLNVPAGLARTHGSAQAALPAGLTVGTLTLIDDQSRVRLLPGVRYRIRLATRSSIGGSTTSSDFSDGMDVRIPLADPRVETFQLALDDTPRTCGSSARPCSNTSGASTRIAGGVELASLAAGRRVTVSIYQQRSGTWQIDDSMSADINLNGDFLVTLPARDPGTYRVDVLLPQGVGLRASVTYEYMTWQ